MLLNCISKARNQFSAFKSAETIENLEKQTNQKILENGEKLLKGSKGLDSNWEEPLPNCASEARSQDR